jgi:hypothetical protein
MLQCSINDLKPGEIMVKSISSLRSGYKLYGYHKEILSAAPSSSFSPLRKIRPVGERRERAHIVALLAAEKVPRSLLCSHSAELLQGPVRPHWRWIDGEKLRARETKGRKHSTHGVEGSWVGTVHRGIHFVIEVDGCWRQGSRPETSRLTQAILLHSLSEIDPG